jgi:hypothetical protein
MRLSPDWFTEGLLDFEYKKYVLMGYLQQVSREFAEEKLYPSLSELVFHYNNLHHFQENKRRLYEQFPAQLNEEAFRKLRLERTPELEDGQDLLEIEQVVAFALPALREQLSVGKDMYEQVESGMQIEPVGILPLYRQEGYVFFRVETSRRVSIYRYRIVFFENTEANYHGISLAYVDSFEHGLATTFESVKLQLARRFHELPNPATWLLYTTRPAPEAETLMPVAKRKLLAYLKGAA